MDEIGIIYLSWRKGLGERRHLVGKIRRNATQGTRFSYIQGNVERAQEDGFHLYTEFPFVGKIYEENVLDTFGQRIVKLERSDASDFYDFWEIDQELIRDKYYMLAKTQGLNPADNFEFLASYNPVKGLRFLTDLAGMSQLKLPPDTLKVGDKLDYELEKGNAYDSFAVKLLKSGQEVGYIKKVHSRVFHKGHFFNFRVEVKATEVKEHITRIFVRVTL